METSRSQPLPSLTTSDGHDNQKARMPFLQHALRVGINPDDVHNISLGHASTDDMSNIQVPPISGTQRPPPSLAFISNIPHNDSQNEASHQSFFEPSGGAPSLSLGILPTEQPLYPKRFESHDIGDSDSEDSNIFSGVSSPGRALRRDMRSFPPGQMLREEAPAFPGYTVPITSPLGFHRAARYPQNGHHRHENIQMGGTEFRNNNLSQMQIVNNISAIPSLWAEMYDQRRKTRLNRKKMAELRNQILRLRSEKTRADNDLQRLTLSHSQSGQSLPPFQSAMLVEKARNIQDECSSVEARYEKLDRELRHREKKLETSEIRFFQSISTGADTSQPGIPRLAELSFHQPSNLASAHNSLSIQMTGHNVVQAAAVPSPLSSNSFPMSDVFFLGLSGERPTDVHPLYTHLLQLSGALNSSRQNYEDLISEQQDILGDLQSRVELDMSSNSQEYGINDLTVSLNSDPGSDKFHAAFSGYINKSDQEFLQTFDEAESASRDLICSQERQVARIREACVRLNVLPNNISFEKNRIAFGDSNESDDEGIVLDILASHLHPNSSPVTTSFPILVTNPLIVAAQYPLPPKEALRSIVDLPEDNPRRRLLFDDYIKEYGIISSLSRAQFDNKADFVNRWLLQSLRMSPLSALQLYATFSTILRVINVTQWQKDVIHFWTRDGTNEPEQFFEGPVTEPLSSSSATSSSSADNRQG